MSVSLIYEGGIQAAAPVRLTTTSATDIVTAPTADNTIIISSFSLANETGSAVQMSVHYYDGTTDFLWFARSVPANDTIIVCEIPMRLRGGQKMKATAATGNAITVTPIVTRLHKNVAVRPI